MAAQWRVPEQRGFAPGMAENRATQLQSSLTRDCFPMLLVVLGGPVIPATMAPPAPTQRTTQNLS